MKVEIKEKVLTDFICQLFIALGKIDGFASFEYFSSLSSARTSSAKLVKLVDEVFSKKLTGLFLLASSEEVEKRNNINGRRWYTNKFSFQGQEAYLSSQWNDNGDFQLTTEALTHFLKSCYDNGISIEHTSDKGYKTVLDMDNNMKEFATLTPGQRITEFVNYAKQGMAERSARGYVSGLRDKYTTEVLSFLEITDSLFNISDISVLEKVQNEFKRRRDAVASTGEYGTKKNYPSYLGKYIDFANYYNSNGPVTRVEEPDSPSAPIVHDSTMLSPESTDIDFPDDMQPMQVIYYGAPGTGKSNTIKRMEEDEKNKLICTRVTFHPDTDYSSFVGCYKPHKDGQDLTYTFVAQPFMDVYVDAWKNPKSRYALVIEEINRGNCAQIFGDIFQLLDRDDDGFSTYPIKADTDIVAYLREKLGTAYLNAINKRYKKDHQEIKLMALPPNMSLLATMNTSDQSLFPMDSAFKRRWDWEYQPICQGVDSETGKLLEWKIMSDEYDWWKFLTNVNQVIAKTTESEDKMLGFFFTKPEKGGEVISPERFVGKVVFYIWNDVFKMYGFQSDIFNSETKGKKLEFRDFYNTDKTVNTDVLKTFLDNVKNYGVSTSSTTTADED